MDLRALIVEETSAFTERLISVSESAVQNVAREAAEAADRLQKDVAALRAELEAATSRSTTLEERLDAETERASALAAQLDAETLRGTTLSSQIETEAARVTALTTDLEAANLALRKADEDRLNAVAAQEAVAGELRGVRELLEAARAEAVRASESFQAEAAEKAIVQQAHDLTVKDLQSKLETAAAEMNTLRASLADAEARATETATAMDVQLQTLRAQLQDQAAMAGNNDARVEAAEAAAAAMRAQVDEANAISDAASAELTAMRERVRGITAMLNGAAASLDALGTATTVDGVFSQLLQQMANRFQRVAIFRVKGNHLEGEVAAGLDDSVDISKIVIPLGLRSVITRAAANRDIEQATKEQIDESRSPLGGSPESSVAAPLVFEGEVLAVAYADSDAAVTDAHVPFTAVLVRHANALLASLAQQLKAARQLRDYARLLLHEAESMFNADLESNVPQHERLQRLRHSVQFAHDLYAQRAALEPSVSVDVLEEEIAAIVGRDSSTPFAEGLAAIHQDRAAQRSA